MADLNKAVVANTVTMAHGFGNVIRSDSKYAAAAAAENDVIYVAKVPAYSKITDARLVNAALGATNGLTMKLIDKAGVDVVGGELAVTADASAAGSTRMSAAPITVGEEAVWAVVLKTGAGAATGEIDALIDYEYLGN